MCHPPYQSIYSLQANKFLLSQTQIIQLMTVSRTSQAATCSTGISKQSKLSARLSLACSKKHSGRPSENKLSKDIKAHKTPTEHK